MSELISAGQIEEAVRWRRDLHRHPELAFQERRTSDFVARQLGEWGYRVERGYGQTGLVGTLRKGLSQRAIGIRADMDALPIAEDTGLPHASATAGVMHACGHDGHVSMALAAARAAADRDFDGTVHFIFQPAEENEAGARFMIEDGLFRNHAMDAVYGLHNWPALAPGHLVARPDRMMAALGTFEIVITGRGSHGAMPHEGADPVVAASQVVGALQTIASRNISALEPAVVSVTQIHAGNTWNVIPEQVTLRGTTRWFDDAIGATIGRRMEAVAASIAEGLGCSARTSHVARYPATVNDPACAAIVRETAAHVAGITVTDAAPSMAAEDFAFMLREKPGCYFWLGSARDGENPGLHSPRFDFNDDILPLGASMWVALIGDALRKA